MVSADFLWSYLDSYPCRLSFYIEDLPICYLCSCDSEISKSVNWIQAHSRIGLLWPDLIRKSPSRHLIFSQFSCSVMSDSLWPHGLQHARPPCPSQTPGAYPNSCPLSQWCHPTISSSVLPFSSHLQSFPASGSFPMSQLFTSGGQSTGVSASTSILPMNTQDWFPLGWTSWISLQFKGLSVLLQHHSSKASILQRSALFIVQLSHIHTWPLEKP